MVVTLGVSKSKREVGVAIQGLHEGSLWQWECSVS